MIASEKTKVNTRDMAAPKDEKLDILSPFYGVVLNHRMGSGQRVRWSPAHDAWTSNKDYSRHLDDPWRSEPGEVFGQADAPYEDELVAALVVAERVLAPGRNPFYCEFCFRNDAQAHFIAPNVTGDPTLYCVQSPAYSVVESSGGNGRVKHWGSPFGCQSVEHHISSGRYIRDPYIGPVAAYVYGRPLPADEVINREWCSRCVGAAQNVRTNASVSGVDESDWARERTQANVRSLSRRLVDYYGD